MVNPIWRLCNPKDWLVKLTVMMRLDGKGCISTVAYPEAWWYYVFTFRDVHLPQSNTVSKETPWRLCCCGRWRKRWNGRQRCPCGHKLNWIWTWDRSRTWCETEAKHIWKERKKLTAFANRLLNATFDAVARGFLQYSLLLIRFVRCTRWQQSI